MLTQEDALKNLAEAVVKRDRKKVEELAQQVVAEKLDAFQAIDKGLAAGMEIVGQKFDRHEFFVPELLMAAKSMMTGIEILKPHISVLQAVEKGTCVIGTVKGDTHAIGKDIVAIVLEAYGFKVCNPGTNVEHQIFMDKAQGAQCGHRRPLGPHVHHDERHEGHHQAVRGGRGAEPAYDHGRRRAYQPEVVRRGRCGRLCAQCRAGRGGRSNPAAQETQLIRDP